MSASLNLELDKHVTVGKTEAFNKATRSAARHRSGYDEGMESRTVMVPANGIVHKLRDHHHHHQYPITEWFDCNGHVTPNRMERCKTVTTKELPSKLGERLFYKIS